MIVNDFLFAKLSFYCIKLPSVMSVQRSFIKQYMHTNTDLMTSTFSQHFFINHLLNIEKNYTCIYIYIQTICQQVKQ